MLKKLSQSSAREKRESKTWYRAESVSFGADMLRDRETKEHTKERNYLQPSRPLGFADKV